ncbi:MAG: ATP-binding protein [Polyangiaceae bacterium]|nr:ATP-binding protein [Polyangiaceae bacterium]
MKIARVFTTGVERLSDRQIDLTSPASGAPRDLVVITGPPGCGKTALLDILVAAKETAAPYGARLPWTPRAAPGEAAAKIQIDWVLSPDEIALFPGEPRRTLEVIYDAQPAYPPENDAGLIALLQRFDEAPDTGKVEYFHAERRLSGGLRMVSGVRSERALRLEANDRKYAGIEAFLIDLHLGVDDRPGLRDRFQEAFGALCPRKRWAGISRAAGSPQAVFEGPRGERLGLAELSHSEKQALLFVATFLRVGLSNSVVLIDVPELYLRSEEVVPFVRALAGLGENNQLIVASGSHELIQSVEPGAVVRLD